MRQQRVATERGSRNEKVKETCDMGYERDVRYERTFSS